MAKSPLAGLVKIKAKTTTNSPDIINFNFKVSLHYPGRPRPIYFDIKDFCYLGCMPENPLIKPCRMGVVKNIHSWVSREFKNKSSHATIISGLRALKRYFCFCDKRGLQPLHKEGYLAFAGNDGELWRQVGIAIEPKPFKFMYENKEEMGLSEGSASILKANLDKMLLEIGFDTSKWDGILQKFSEGTRSYTLPYTSSEWELLFRRVQRYFFSLATALIEYRSDNPGLPPPQIIENIEMDVIDKAPWCITVGEAQQRHHGGECSAFNQCMSAAYVLFCYYTAFNDSVIQEVRHPLRKLTDKKDGRTLKTVSVKVYKGRSSKEVGALFSDLDESQHPEANKKTVGYIVGEVEKKNGIVFIETLEVLSKAYSSDTHGRLIYSLGVDGGKKNKDIVEGIEYLTENLRLVSEGRQVLVDHFVGMYREVVECKRSVKYSVIRSNSGFNEMRVTRLPVQNSLRNQTPLAYAAISCLTDVELNNVILPIGYSEMDEEGNVTISLSYIDGDEDSIVVEAKYLDFFRLLERQAEQFNPKAKVRTKYSGGSSTRPPFLLPLGSRNATYQWGTRPPITRTILQNLGVHTGEYYLSINSRKIRATNSDLEYRSEEKGATARQILQNSINTFQRKYVNGHPTENNRMLSQGLMGLSNIANGMTKEEAVNAVKNTLKIPVLAFDKWKAKRMPTNPNGIACDGKVDLVEGKNEHAVARKFALREGFMGESNDITCYQYDLCVFCNKAQLVDDPHAIYKLLSFLDALRDAIDLYPSRSEVIQKKIERFELHLEDISYQTIEESRRLLDENGRYFLFKSSNDVAQYL